MTSTPQALDAGIRPPGFRLPAATHVDSAVIQVADLERSLEFYRDAVGFRLLERSPAGGAAFARLGSLGSDHVLMELREKQGAHPVPRRGLLGLYHTAVLLPDRASLGRFLLHMVSKNVHVGAADHLFSEALYLTDPDGLTLEVYCDRPRDSWTIRNHEIIGTSDPLDFGDVEKAAGSDSSWEGLPAGTVIGHMHFYVADLDAASRFYHAALGLDKVSWSLPGALFMSAGGYHHHVGVNTWAAGSPVATEDDAKLVEWRLALPTKADVDAAAASLHAQGHVVSATLGGYVANDPWGITVRLISDS
jgi:catechol 2,3-dioxygenase